MVYLPILRSKRGTRRAKRNSQEVNAMGIDVGTYH